MSSHRRAALFRVTVQDEWQEIISKPRLLRWVCIAHREPAFCSKIHVPVQRDDMSEGLRNTWCGNALRGRSEMRYIQDMFWNTIQLRSRESGARVPRARTMAAFVALEQPDVGIRQT